MISATKRRHRVKEKASRRWQEWRLSPECFGSEYIGEKLAHLKRINKVTPKEAWNTKVMKVWANWITFDFFVASPFFFNSSYILIFWKLVFERKCSFSIACLIFVRCECSFRALYLMLWLIYFFYIKMSFCFFFKSRFKDGYRLFPHNLRKSSLKCRSLFGGIFFTEVWVYRVSNEPS